tara:strand:- start:1393 stop:2520 length:1128 start_codon:yes stop_codon:yes gene_type:complete
VTAVLRVMLDQLVAPTDNDLKVASGELVRALIAHAPQGCEVEGIAPAAGGDGVAALSIPGMAGVRRTSLPRRELAGALQLGVATGIGGGMIHAPSLFAPLVKHDRVHNNDQTSVTVWDLRPWDAPDELSRSSVAWHKAMLKRAVKHADAVVVPTHAMARRLGEIARLGDRIRVISGAAPEGFRVPTDEIGRRRELDLPEGYVVLAGTSAESDALAAGFGAVARSGHDVPVVVVDAGEGEEPAIAEIAAAAGVPARLVHVRGALADADRGAVFGAAVAYVAPSTRAVFPWRTVEAMALGVPVIAADSDVVREVVVDGGTLVSASDADAADALGAALADALGSTTAAERLAVMAADRGRVFSWLEAADKIWALHAEL